MVNKFESIIMNASLDSFVAKVLACDPQMVEFQD